jgi:hypothetical protein
MIEIDGRPGPHDKVAEPQATWDYFRAFDGG